MLLTRTQSIVLYADRATQQWVALDREGKLWQVPVVENAWEKRTPFDLTDETELEPVPGHYKTMLGLPF